MKTTTFFFGFAACVAFAMGCNSNNNNGTPADAAVDVSIDQGTVAEAGVTVEAGVDGSAVPSVPTLGTQIDRIGRPAINTALNNEFNGNTVAQGMAKDAYNFDNNPAHWSTYVPEFEMSLAVFDGLDNTCGNQLAYGALGNPGYTTLATLLAADTLWLNTAATTCTTYLAVEANALGVTNTDCGGRTLTYNVIDITYNDLAGTFTIPPAPGPVTNGIFDAASAPTTTFPFLAAVH
jgi:hypothetical protein